MYTYTYIIIIVINEHYPRDPDPEIGRKEATGDKAAKVCIRVSKRDGLWVWASFVVLDS